MKYETKPFRKPRFIFPLSGYKGTVEIRLAAESGEVAGGCWTWDSIKATWSGAIKSGAAVVVLQILAKPHPELPKRSSGDQLCQIR